MKMDNTVRFSLLTLAFIASIWALYVTRDIMAPLALAIFIWLIIDAFAQWMDNLSPKLPYWLALTIAILTIVMGFVGYNHGNPDKAHNNGQNRNRQRQPIRQLWR